MMDMINDRIKVAMTNRAVSLYRTGEGPGARLFLYKSRRIRPGRQQVDAGKINCDATLTTHQNGQSVGTDKPIGVDTFTVDPWNAGGGPLIIRPPRSFQVKQWF
jgi:hypothetical protein